MNHSESVLPTLIVPALIINRNERNILYGCQGGLAMDHILHLITPVVMTVRLDHFKKVGGGH
jgi:hypothetical protein